MTGKSAEVRFGDEPRAVLYTSMGELTLEFLTDKAPRTCENFVRLAANGFYDGLTFHRIIKDFMVQGGCPKGDGTGGPGYTIKPEFNDTPHVRGVVSMARSNDPHSAGSQFFIVHGDARYLDFQYAAFARVVEGDEVLERIATTDVEESRFREMSKPRIQVFINRIELQDVDVVDHGPDRSESESKGEGKGGSKQEDESEDESQGGEAKGGSKSASKADADSSSDDDDDGDDDGDDDDGGSSGGRSRSKSKKKTSKKKSSSRRSGDGDDSGGDGGEKSAKKKTTKKKSSSKGRKKSTTSRKSSKSDD